MGVPEKIIAIVFVFYLSHNFFQNIFNGDKTRGQFMFVQDNGHVAALGTKLFQEDIKTLALGE